MEQVRVVIEVRNGNVVAVYGGNFIDVVLVDWDNINAGDTAGYIDPTPFAEMPADTAQQIVLAEA